MYQPRHFRVDDRQRQHALIREHALALLVAVVDGCPQAGHVPVVLDADDGTHGALRFHLARANPIARALDGSREALLVFLGEESYVSPDWYRSEHMVPTWNYAAVHARGTPRALDDDALCRLLDDLSGDQERRLDKRPWRSDKLPPDRYASMRRAIAGFRMPVETLHGKWKMGQNRSADDRRGIADALSALGTARAAGTARVMRALLESGPRGENDV